MKKSNFPVRKSVAVLLDPDKAVGEALTRVMRIAESSHVDYIFTGGSLTFRKIDNLIDEVKKLSSIPVVLFPGNLLQITHKADVILLLSLISGRNPEFLIGNHVIAAPYLKDVREKLVSVGYILINCGKKTSVEYISQTEAIPANKPEITVATALAGEMLGLSMIYLEAGSGAETPVPLNIVEAVRASISIPVAVGGGIRSSAEIENFFKSGADLVIIGNGCEKHPELLIDACRIRDNYRSENS